MTSIKAAIKELNARIATTEKELSSLKEAVSILRKLGTALDGSTKAVPVKRKRRMSAAGRARIAAGQKARWAKVAAAKSSAKVEAKPAKKKKRKMSAAGIAAIRAGVKARMARMRAEKAKK